MRVFFKTTFKYLWPAYVWFIFCVGMFIYYNVLAANVYIPAEAPNESIREALLALKGALLAWRFRLFADRWLIWSGLSGAYLMLSWPFLMKKGLF